MREANVVTPVDTGSSQTDIHLGKFADETSADVDGGTDPHVALGSFVHDSATATGGPLDSEGTVDFTFYTNPTDPASPCESATEAAAGSVTLDTNGVAHPSNDEGALGAGSYAFTASLHATRTAGQVQRVRRASASR